MFIPFYIVQIFSSFLIIFRSEITALKLDMNKFEFLNKLFQSLSPVAQASQFSTNFVSKLFTVALLKQNVFRDTLFTTKLSLESLLPNWPYVQLYQFKNSVIIY